METRLDDVCKDLSEIKADLKAFVANADVKYATKTEVSNIKKMIYTFGGALIGFLIWSLQEYLKHIGG